MKRRIKEFSLLTGVSVRTLHYYDEIGLLKPCYVDEQNSYRFYDETSLERMQEILFYRELDFPLKSIAEILASPNYDKQKALAEQKRLLTLKKERLTRLIAALEQAEKGEITMSAFDNSEYETARQQYEDEAKRRWGDTAAYQEYEQRGNAAASAGLMAVFETFAAVQTAGNAPDSEVAQKVVARLQEYITAHFYTCTKEILSGLGQMYVCDPRFRENIDRYGEGTADYASKAIAVYCR
ncbi:MAG: MerR family transcriptional regulator [Ruminococcaceae bacterium]|nr:MerR family transcriptional regulator [Oscillospiraceae bacterium]